MFFTETVIRLRAAIAVDPYSGEEDGQDWSAPDLLTVDAVAFTPAGSEFAEPGRVAVDNRPTLYRQIPADVAAGDRVEYGGKTYEVDGDPDVWLLGQVIRLKIREG